MNKFKSKIPRDDLKRFAKEISKKLADSDFKGGRVEDPTKISEKQQHKVKKYCKDFFEKAAYKHNKHEKEKAANKAKSATGTKANGAHASVKISIATSPTQRLDASPDMEVTEHAETDEEDVRMSEVEPDEDEKATPDSPTLPVHNNDVLKRKRPASEDHEDKVEDELTKSPLKKLNLDSPTPPPPPPPPPMETTNGTPGQSADASPEDTSLHADTSFKSKSMADVLAEAQQDSGDDADVSMLEANTTFEKGLKENGLLHVEEVLDNPMVDGQVKQEANIKTEHT